MKQQAVVLNEKDNVATALTPLKKGQTLELVIGEKKYRLVLNEDIPFGHKFCLKRIKTGSPVIKYGEVIGNATANINAGDYVHVHNVVSARGRGDLNEVEK